MRLMADGSASRKYWTSVVMENRMSDRSGNLSWLEILNNVIRFFVLIRVKVQIHKKKKKKEAKQLVVLCLAT